MSRNLVFCEMMCNLLCKLRKNIVRNILHNTLTYFGAENVSSCVDHAFPVRGFEKGGSVAGVVDETVDVEQKVEVLGRLGQEERLHPVLQQMVAGVFHCRVATISPEVKYKVSSVDSVKFVFNPSKMQKW